MNRNAPRRSRWELRPGDLPDERILRAEPRLHGLENNAAFRARRLSQRANIIALREGIRPILGLHYRLFAELRMSGVGAEQFALAGWGIACGTRRLRIIRRTLFLIVSALAICAYLGPADFGGIPSGRRVSAWLMFYAPQASLALLCGHSLAHGRRGVPWSALASEGRSRATDPMAYPYDFRRWFELVPSAAKTIALLCLVVPPLGFVSLMALLGSVALVLVGIWEGNWHPLGTLSLLGSGGVIAGALLGAALGWASARIDRRHANRNYSKLIERIERILRDLPDEASWERAARRRS